MHLYIDGDGCPVVDLAISIALDYGLQATIICDTAHSYVRDDVDVIVVDQGRDSADFALLNRLSAFDLLITQDSGLAALALGKKAIVLNQNGFEYNEENILQILNQRSDGIKIRKKTNRFSHIAKRTMKDDDDFCQGLIIVIERSIHG